MEVWNGLCLPWTRFYDDDYNEYYHQHHYYFLFLTAIFYPCSSTFLSLCAVLRNVTFWINSTCIVILNVLRFSSRPLGIVPKAPMTISITLASTFQSFLISLSRSWHLFTFSYSCPSTLVSSGTAMSVTSALLFSLSTTTISGRQCSITWSVWEFTSHRILNFIIITIIITINDYYYSQWQPTAEATPFLYSTGVY